MVVDFMGGLGNQMFQYAFGRALSKMNDSNLYFRQMQSPNAEGHIRYMLAEYKLGLSWDYEAAKRQFCYGGKVPGYDPNVFDQALDTRFIGYWQSEQYYGPYASLIRDELANPRSGYDAYTMSMGDRIVATAGHSACIHVRRGDYLNPTTGAFHGNLDNSYYAEAIDRIQQADREVKFFVFSDDAEYCKKNFPSQFTVVEGTNRHPGWDIWLMSLCQHAVIANSSFSWWGAWLGDRRRDGLVFAPKKWFKADVDETGIVPERWTRI